jgi:hypothetical protein
MTMSEEAALAEDGFAVALWTWAAEIILAPYAEGLDVAIMARRWHESR